MSNPTIEKIEHAIKSSKVVLFVKGTPNAPMCGFSKAVMGLFEQMNVPFKTVDVLSNPDIRASLPEYSQWPTFPQVFIDGKLVGGSDIVHEMHESGELQKLVS